MMARVFEEESVVVPWCVGDVLLINNLAGDALAAERRRAPRSATASCRGARLPPQAPGARLRGGESRGDAVACAAAARANAPNVGQAQGVGGGELGGLELRQQGVLPLQRCREWRRVQIWEMWEGGGGGGGMWRPVTCSSIRRLSSVALPGVAQLGVPRRQLSAQLRRAPRARREQPARHASSRAEGSPPPPPPPPPASPPPPPNASSASSRPFPAAAVAASRDAAAIFCQLARDGGVPARASLGRRALDRRRRRRLGRAPPRARRSPSESQRTSAASSASPATRSPPRGWWLGEVSGGGGACAWRRRRWWWQRQSFTCAASTRAARRPRAPPRAA